MTTIEYKIIHASASTSYNRPIDSIYSTNPGTFCEVDQDTLDLELGFPASVLTKVIFEIKVQVKITLRLIQKGGKQVEPIVQDVPNGQSKVIFNIEKAFCKLERRDPNLPIQLVYVLIKGPGGETLDTPPRKKPLLEEDSETFYSSTPPRNSVHVSSSPSSMKRTIEGVNSFSSGGGLYNLRPRQSPIFQKSGHTMRNEQITQPYAQALEGCCITALADPEHEIIIRKMCKVMGGCYILDFSDLTQFLVVDSSRDEKLFAQARRFNVSIVRSEWLLECQTQNRQVEVEKFLVH